MFKPGVVLKPYQQRAALFAFTKRNAAIFMAKGTGKTLISLKVAILCKARVILIVTNTKASAENWRRQVDLFIDPSYLQTIRIIVTLYNPYDYDIDKPDIIILDESHSIKNRRSKRFRALMRLVRRFTQARRLLLTATPISIDAVDLWSQYVFLGVLERDWTTFKEDYCRPYGYMSLGVRLRREKEKEFMDALNKCTVYAGEEILNLKPHTNNNIYLDLSTEVREIYHILEVDFILSIEGTDILTPNTLAKMSKLHQICGGCVKTDCGVKLLPNPKKDWILKYIKRHEEKLVIFCAYNNEITQLSLALTDAGVNHILLYGDKSERNGWMRFQRDKNVRVIIVQFKSGSQGIDLTAAKTVIYYSINFNYIDHDQSLGRIRRMGQEHATTAIYLLARDTIDEIVFKNIAKKGRVAQAIFTYFKGVQHDHRRCSKSDT